MSEKEKMDLEVVEIDTDDETVSSTIQDKKSTILGPPPCKITNFGRFQNKRPEIDDEVLVMKKPLQPWIKGKVTTIISKSPMTYRVKLIPKNYNNQMKPFLGKQIALCTQAKSLIPVKSRVVALFEDGKHCEYYSGIVAEFPKSTNKQSYLIFYDDGHAQYVKPENVFVVSESSANVWEDVPKESSKFVENYVKKFPEIPMTKLVVDQIIKTEWNGKWWKAKVLQVDASLVQIHFEADKRTEWIYRGSLRLEPLYIESLKIINNNIKNETLIENKNKENISEIDKYEEDTTELLLTDETEKINSSPKSSRLSIEIPKSISSHGLVATKKVTQIRPSTTSTMKQKQNDNIDLPPNGPLIRQPAEIGDNVLVMTHPFKPWIKAKVTSIVSRNPSTYSVKYNKSEKLNNQIKDFIGKELAIYEPARVIIPVNIRVTAIYEDTVSKKYYSGVIGESPSTINNNRYLIFFDDGYCQYVFHDKICVVNECSPRVWQDVPIENRDFIKKYQDSYPKRRLMKTVEKQVIKTEWNGKWYEATVVDVDASLVQMDFNKGERIEWIYRGSTRLWPLYNLESSLDSTQESEPKPVISEDLKATPTTPTTPDVVEKKKKLEHQCQKLYTYPLINDQLPKKVQQKIKRC